jgi:hypothetical protein
LPVDHWHEAIANPTIADAILDRLVHNAHRLTLKGESMRKMEGLSDHPATHRVQAGRAGLTDTFASGRESPFMKAGCGKTARPVCAADGGQRKSNRARLLRPDVRWAARES